MDKKREELKSITRERRERVKGEVEEKERLEGRMAGLERRFEHLERGLADMKLRFDMLEQAYRELNQMGKGGKG